MAILSDLTTSLRVLGRSGIIRPYSPRKLAGLAAVLLKWGTGPAGGFASLAVREPHRIGLVDELGELDLRRDAPPQQRAGPWRWPSWACPRATRSR